MGLFNKKRTTSEDSDFNDNYYDNDEQAGGVNTSAAEQLDHLLQDNEPSCGKRFVKELNICQPWFPHRDPVNQKLHAIQKSFAPQTMLSKLSKMFLVGFTLGSTIYGMVVHPNIEMYFAYFTNWGNFFTILYGILACYNVYVGLPEHTNFRVRLTWSLYIIALNMTGVIMILFWALVYEPGNTITYLVVAGHGPTFFLLILDGMVIGRIPIRIMHWMGLALPVETLYVGWTLLHAFLDIGNPNLNDTEPDEDNDDVIYQVLDWKNDWDTTLIYCVICLFAVGPFVFLVTWACNVKRRYVDERPKVDDVVEGSIFAEWE